MKTKYILIGFSAGLLGCLASCDVTDIAPRDSITDESYWNTANDLKTFAQGFYTNLGGAEDPKTYDERSDDRLTSAPDNWLFDTWTIPASADDANWTWTTIRNLNYFMSRYDQVDDTEMNINPWVAVVRFFRAQQYFSKIKTFGDVPWYDRDLSTADIEDLYKPRDSRDFVLSKIIEDLDFAIEWLPEKASAEKGAPHKDVARLFLARVCLHYGTYKKYHNVAEDPAYPELSSQNLLTRARDLSKEIMDSGNYSIEMNTSDAGSSQSSFDGYPNTYGNLFQQLDASSCKEAILVRYYEENVLTHGMARDNGVGFSKDFAESFLCLDGKPISVSDQYKGDETLDDEMTNRDPRMYQIIDSKFRPFSVNSSGDRIIHTGYQDPQNTFLPGENPGDNIHSAPDLTGSSSGYTPVKFRSADLNQQNAAGNSYYDYILFRYAEVLLIRAEAEKELGSINQTILDETINQLRDRVGMAHLTMNPTPDVSLARTKYYPSGVDDLLYEIRRERRIELAMEGFRYDDIMRWNAMKVYENPKTFVGIRVTDRMKQYYRDDVINARNTVVLSDDGHEYIQMYTAKTENEPGRKWEDNDKRLFYPLPTTEITIYNAAGYVLEQNPGWE